MAQDQAALITPVTEPLTFVFIPKVIHSWYDVVAEGAQFAAAELAKEDIQVEVIWDQPPTANVANQNQRIEADIGRQPDGLDKATNVQLLRPRCA